MASLSNSAKKLTGPQKAAVFLLVMGQEYTSEIFKNMGDEEITKLVGHMADIKHVPPEIVNQVMEEFVEKLEGGGELVVEGDAFLRSLAEGSLSKEKADVISRHLGRHRKDIPFSYLEEIDAKGLAGALKGEHPQTVALILAHLRPRRAAEILSALPRELQGSVAVRIAEIGLIPNEVIREVDDTLRQEMLSRGDSSSGQKIGGVGALADILNEVDKETEENVMTSIEEQREDLAEEIRQLMFVFEDLLKLDDRGMREILKQVETQQLTVALKTASEEMRAKVFGNLSQRAADMLREDMEVMGPVRLAEVEKAQQDIVRIAGQLEAEGKIVVAKGADDVFV